MNSTIESGSRLGDRMPWRRSRFARALVFLLTQAMVLQPATVMAAASDWDVAQQPLFTVNPVHPNVVFMIDDSWSMNDYRLPPPQFLLENGRWPAAATVQVKYGVGPADRCRAGRVHAALVRCTIRWPMTRRLPTCRGTTTTSRLRRRARVRGATRTSRRPTSAVQAPSATAGRFTERDMRHVGFANGNSNAIRKWITRVARQRGRHRLLTWQPVPPLTAGVEQRTGAGSSPWRIRRERRSTRRCRATAFRRPISSRIRP